MISNKDHFGFDLTHDINFLDESERDRLEKYQQSYAEMEKKRVEDWASFLQKPDFQQLLEQRAEEAVLLVKQGIPHAERPRIWPILLGSQKLEEEKIGTYCDLLLGSVQDQNSVCHQEIKLDVERTFPTHEFFQSSGPGADKLEKLLQACAISNPQIGYCQGMNFLCGLLLFVFNGEEEKTYWAMCRLLETITPNYFIPDMTGIQIDQRVLKELIFKHLNGIATHVEELQTLLPILSMKWFLCLFIGSFCMESILLVWDSILCFGSSMLFSLSLALLKLHSDVILGSNFSLEILQTFKAKAFLCDPTQLIETALVVDKEITSDISSLRYIHGYQLKKEMAELKKNKRVSKLQKKTIMTKEEFEALHASLRNSCASGITLEKFEEAFRMIAPERQFNKELVNDMFEAFDTEQNKLLSFNGIVCGLALFYRGSADEKLRFIFQSGEYGVVEQLDKKQVHQLLQQIVNTYYEPAFSPIPNSIIRNDFIDKAFTSVDTDMDGKITLEEFKTIAMSHPIILQCFANDRADKRSQKPKDRSSRRQSKRSSRGAQLSMPSPYGFEEVSKNGKPIPKNGSPTRDKDSTTSSSSSSSSSLSPSPSFSKQGQTVNPTPVTRACGCTIL